MMVSTFKTSVKRVAKNALHKLGYNLSRYFTLDKAKTGFVDNVFGYKLYQNVDDVAIDYSGYSGIELQEAGLSLGVEMGVIIKEIRQGANVIDIGANVGLITLLLAKIVGPAGTVIAFEPGPVSFAILKLNILINGCKNIVPINKAVSSTSGMENLFICPTGESDNQVSINELDWKDEIRESIPIETISLDDYFDSNRDHKIDFIKIDIQGGEFKALKGMRNLLIRNRDIRLTIEYAPCYPLWKDLKSQAFLDFIRSLEFKIYDLSHAVPEPVTDKYLINTYPKDDAVHKMTTLLLQRT